jgi:transcriptional regulator with XRE-family HTH domain
MKIATNIRHLRQQENWSQQQFADELDIPRSRVGSYEEGRCVPPVDVLIRMSTLFHITVDALVKTDLTKVEKGSMMKVAENRILFPILIDKDGHDMIEVVGAKASAGYLNGYADPEYMEKLPVMNLPFRITGKHRAFAIKGDSMPPLRDGSFVIGKFVESLNEIRNGSTYVLVTKDEGIVYKRVTRKGSILELHSDNKVYDMYTVKASDVLEVWQFVCTLNLSDKKEEELNLDSIMDMLRSMRVEIEKIGK